MNDIVKDILEISDSLDLKGFEREADYLDKFAARIVKNSADSLDLDEYINRVTEHEADSRIGGDPGTDLMPLEEVYDMLSSDDAEDLIMGLINDDKSDDIEALNLLLSMNRTIEAAKRGLMIGRDGALSRIEGDVPRDYDAKTRDSLAEWRLLFREVRKKAEKGGLENFNALVANNRAWASEQYDRLTRDTASDFAVDESHLIRKSKMDKARTPEERASLDPNTPATEVARFILGNSGWSLEGLIEHYSAKIKEDSELASLDRKYNDMQGTTKTPSLGRVNPKLMAEIAIPNNARETLTYMKTTTRPDGKTVYDAQMEKVELKRAGREAQKAEALEHPRGRETLGAAINDRISQLKNRELSEKKKEVIRKSVDSLKTDYEYFFGEDSSEGYDLQGGLEVASKRGAGRAKKLQSTLRDFWCGEGESGHPCTSGWAYPREFHNEQNRPQSWPEKQRTNNNGEKVTFRPVPPELRKMQFELDSKNPYLEDFKNLTVYSEDWAGLEASKEEGSRSPSQDSYDLVKSVLYNVPSVDLPDRLRLQRNLSLAYLKVGVGHELDEFIKKDLLMFFSKRLNVPYDPSRITKSNVESGSRTFDEKEQEEKRRDLSFQFGDWLKDNRGVETERPAATETDLPADLPMLGDLDPEEEDSFNPMLTRSDAEEIKSLSEANIRGLMRLAGVLDEKGLAEEADFLDKIAFNYSEYL
jgi:hypothetical protein